MFNKLNKTDIKNKTYYFFDDMIKKKIWFQIKPRQMKSHAKIFLFTTLATRHLYLFDFIYFRCFVNKTNGNFQDSYENEYLTLVSANESKRILKNINPIHDGEGDKKYLPHISFPKLCDL